MTWLVAASSSAGALFEPAAEAPPHSVTRGAVKAAAQRPATFPHRIWAACDFEGRTPDYAWFGPAETNNIPKYPGNRTALGVSARPYRKTSAVMTGINPVPGPRMGRENGLFLRYFLTGGMAATFQHFSLHAKITGTSTCPA